MNKEQQRIAIAEFCVEDRQEPPDYPNDLNAMHEAEKHLSSWDQPRYIDAVNRACGLHWGRTVLATAKQRAEALLRTIGKWVDD